MPHRTFQVPRRSRKSSRVETRGVRPPCGVSSQPRNPGTFSFISPPPVETGGPQQGGLFESVVGRLPHAPEIGFVSSAVFQKSLFSMKSLRRNRAKTETPFQRHQVLTNGDQRRPLFGVDFMPKWSPAVFCGPGIRCFQKMTAIRKS